MKINDLHRRGSLRESVFLRSLAGYLLIALVILILTCLPTLRRIHTIAENQVREAANGSMEALIKQLDDACAEMDRYAYECQNEGKMIPYLLEHDAYYSLQAQQSLNKMVTVNDLYTSVALVYSQECFSSTPRIYASDGVMNADLYFGFHYCFAQWTQSELYASIPEQIRPVLRPLEQVSKRSGYTWNSYIYIAPLSMSGVNHRGVMLFLISDSQMDRMIHKANIPETAVVTIQDAEGKILIQTPSDAPFPNTDLPETDKWYSGILLGEKRYSVVQSVSSRNQWRYTYAISQDEINRHVTSESVGILIIIGLGLIAAGILSVYLTTRSIKPIQRLLEMAIRINPQTINNAGDDIQRIGGTLLQLEIARMNLNTKLHAQRDLVRNHTLERFFYGGDPEAKSLLSLLQEENLTLDGPFFRIVVFRIDEVESITRRMGVGLLDNIRYSMMDLLEEAASGLRLKHIACQIANTHLCVLFSGESLSVSDLDRIVLNFHTRVKEYFQLDLTTGISSEFVELQDAPQYYREAWNATQRRYLNNLYNIHYAVEEKHIQEEDLRWLNEQLTRIGSRLHAEKFDECIGLIHEYVGYLRSSACTPEEAGRMMTMLTVSVQQALRLIPGLQVDMSRLLIREYENIQLLENDLNDILKLCQSSYVPIQNEHNAPVVSAAITYLTDHFSENTLSMDVLTRTLGVSATLLTQAFKEQHGTTPMQYLESLRIEHACRLLRETDLKIPEIVEACGYVDKANFMRKFKKLFSVTPMEFRRMSRENSEERSVDSESIAQEEENE